MNSATYDRVLDISLGSVEDQTIQTVHSLETMQNLIIQFNHLKQTGLVVI